MKFLCPRWAVLGVALLPFACTTGDIARVQPAGSAEPPPAADTPPPPSELPGQPDTIGPVPDVAEDAAPPDCDGCFLDECEDNTDCLSGWCVQHMGKSVCTQDCLESCPAGWSCKHVAGTDPDVIFVCVSDLANLCRPCDDSSDCQSVGKDDLCVGYGSEGSFCGGQCELPGRPGEGAVASGCPDGFTCTEVDDGGSPSLQCVADAGICECTSLSIALGLSTTCSATNANGTCTGARQCAAEGLTECGAAVPAPEVCNGKDDDCNGAIDEGLGQTTCGAGECKHSVVLCVDGTSQECNAFEGQGPEICNGKDDDCDGSTDEDFEDKNADGVADCLSGDDDGDGIPDSDDNCPNTPNPDQTDTDLDGQGDACDPDDDGDKSADADDCAPLDDSIYPGADEVCNAVDDDCDELVDEELGEETCGIGACMHTILSCVEGVAAVCDPLEGQSDEGCDGIDNDCDGLADEGFPDLDEDGVANCADDDDDGDGVPDGLDNCPLVHNPDQSDTDGDGFGDVCDFGCWLAAVEVWEEDCDGIPDDVDNCPGFPNPDQTDIDGDGLGDPCDPDDDGDGVLDPEDNCPGTVNAAQEDSDTDGIGDACDPDADGDGVPDDVDNCLGVPNPLQADPDGDGLGNECDTDDDGDGEGDATDCDPLDPEVNHFAVEVCNGKDDNCNGFIDEANAADCIVFYLDVDSDGYGVEEFTQCLCSPVAPYLATESGDCKPFDPKINPGAAELCNGVDDDCDDEVDEALGDLDGDGIADCLDDDDDGDGVNDDKDNCPMVVNPGQENADGDAFGDACDDDDDGDGVPDDDDCDPLDAAVFAGAKEVCDLKDNDCDGVVDGVIQACMNECNEMGTKLCTGGVFGPCSAPPLISCTIFDGCDLGELCAESCPPPPPEVCDGKDNNCNGTKDEGFTCTPGQTDTQSCGPCGNQTRTCTSSCGWGEWGACVNDGVCEPGASKTGGACGSCGVTSMVCAASCQWEVTGCTGQGVCAPGENQTENCGSCGTRTRSCNGSCQWSAWGACSGQGVCTAGQTQSQTCGNCGNQTRSCNSSCQWGGWSGCSGQGPCSSGQTKFEGSCGKCGQVKYQCNGSCQWSSQGCTGEGTCNPGQTQSQGCGNCGTQSRSCHSGCQWNGWSGCSGGGVCSPGSKSTSGCPGTCMSKSCNSSCQWASACTSCSGCSSITKCGLGCPSGFHPTKYGCSFSCGGSCIGGNNQSTCAPTCGTSLTKCGLGCPSGYYPTKYGCSFSCGGSCIGGNNQTTCSLIVGSSLTKCGLGCPGGYYATKYGCSFSCGGSCIGGNNQTTCKKS